MKCAPFIWIGIFSSAIQWTSAQGISATDPSSDASLQLLGSVQRLGPPGVESYAITEAGANHRQWAKTSRVTLENGFQSIQTNSYVEIASGLNRLDDNGRWVPSEAHFELINGAAVARRTAHRVILTSPTDDIPVDLFTPEGLRLSSHVLGLAYFSSTTGKSVMIAEPKPTEGQVFDSEVLYENCFDGEFPASLRYTVTLGGLEQDIILGAQPPTPSEFGFDQNEVVHLQVVTEFLQAPVPGVKEIVVRREADPSRRAGQVEPDLIDELLTFGTMQIGHGTAFDLGGDKATGPAVYKHWESIDGRQVLFEELSLEDAAPLLLNLPVRPQAKSERKSGIARSRREMVARHHVKPSVHREIAIALTRPRQLKGLAMDYSVVQSMNNFSFQGDTTYFLTNAATMSGTTVFEGGTVIKAVPSTGQFVLINPTGTVVCKTAPYRPVFMTARDDDTVGETLPASLHTPSGYYCDRILCTGGADLSNFIIRYAIFGMNLWQSTNYSVSNAQFINCSSGIEIAYGSVNLRNALFKNGYLALSLYYGSICSAEHVTSDGQTYFNSINGNSTNQFFFTNCLITPTNSINAYTGTNNVFLGSNSGVFSTVQAGTCYLAPNSPYRNAGTTNISSTLAASLKRMTTYPPQLLSANVTLSADTIWSPTASRDTDIPDIGYHYQPIDYAVQGCLVESGHKLTIQPGTAIAVYGSTGLRPKSYGTLELDGLADQHICVTDIQNIQDQPGVSTTPVTLVAPTSSATGVVMNLHFVDFNICGGVQNGIISSATGNQYNIQSLDMRDCNCFNGIYVFGSDTGTSHTIANNLFQRSAVSFADKASVNFWNNTLYAGGTSFNQTGTATWAFNDNLFDQFIYSLQTIAHLTQGYNAYVNSGTNRIGITPNNDKILTNLIVYDTGPLGAFYLPTGCVLTNAGSRAAASAGLYHYTTSTNQVKETNTVVDIGFHYVALSAGIPADSDSDGVPDYVEDSNGNGSFDSGNGETDWHTSNSNVSGSTSMQIFTPLK